MAFDFEKLKSVAKQLGGILVMQGNEPEFVIMSYEKFAQNDATDLVSQPDTPSHDGADDALVDQLNKEILALKEEIRQKESTGAELI